MLEGGVDAGVPSVLLSKVAGQAAFNSIQHYVKGQAQGHKAVFGSFQKIWRYETPKYLQLFNG